MEQRRAAGRHSTSEPSPARGRRPVESLRFSHLLPSCLLSFFQQSMISILARAPLFHWLRDFWVKSPVPCLRLSRTRHKRRDPLSRSARKRAVKCHEANQERSNTVQFQACSGLQHQFLRDWRTRLEQPDAVGHWLDLGIAIYFQDLQQGALKLLPEVPHLLVVLPELLLERFPTNRNPARLPDVPKALPEP